MLVLCPKSDPAHHLLRAGGRGCLGHLEPCPHNQSLLRASHVQDQAPHRLAQDQTTVGAFSRRRAPRRAPANALIQAFPLCSRSPSLTLVWLEETAGQYLRKAVLLKKKKKNVVAPQTMLST